MSLLRWFKRRPTQSAVDHHDALSATQTPAEHDDDQRDYREVKDSLDYAEHSKHELEARLRRIRRQRALRTRDEDGPSS